MISGLGKKFLQELISSPQIDSVISQYARSERIMLTLDMKVIEEELLKDMLPVINALEENTII